jgi:hypothetical protein
MATLCEHLERLTAEDFPPQRILNACEECLAERTLGCASRVPIVRRGMVSRRCFGRLSRECGSSGCRAVVSVKETFAHPLYS